MSDLLLLRSEIGDLSCDEECGIVEAFVLRHEFDANDLDLRLVRGFFEIRM